MALFNVVYQDSNGVTQNANNVTYPDVATMVAAFAPSTVISYQLVSPPPGNIMDPTMYVVSFRDAATGMAYQMTINIPSIMPDGTNFYSMADVQSRLSQLNLIFLSSVPATQSGTIPFNNQLSTGPAYVLFESNVTNTTANSAATAGTNVAQAISSAVNGTGSNNTGGTIYRFILQTPDLTSPTGFTYNTGANYNACSQSNTAPCIPLQFASVGDAIDYANAHNEIPCIVGSSAETWSIIGGSTPIPTSTISVNGNAVLSTDGGTTALQSSGTSTTSGLQTAIIAGMVLLALDRFTK